MTNSEEEILHDIIIDLRKSIILKDRKVKKSNNHCVNFRVAQQIDRLYEMLRISKSKNKQKDDCLNVNLTFIRDGLDR